MDRLATIKNLRSRLRGGGVTVGSWMQLPNSSVAEIMGQAGYDWVAVDLEHGAIDLQVLPDLFRALELGGTLPLARLAQATAQSCKQVCDAGAGGVIAPMVESAEQLREIVSWSRWPPAGRRGVGFSRANLFGRHFERYAQEAQSPLVVAMIEHGRAVENLESILSVDGLDAILIGPYDLSASLGMTARFDEPVFVAALERIRSLCSARGVPCGLHVVAPDPALLRQRVNEGYRFIAYSIDSVFLETHVRRPVEPHGNS